MNSFLVYWRDSEPLILGNGRRITPSIISPLSDALPTQTRYVQVLGTKTATLDDVGLLVDATPEYKAIASLQRLMSATLSSESDGSREGDVFVPQGTLYTAMEVRLGIAGWDSKLVGSWIPVICTSENSDVGWIRVSAEGEAEGVFLAEGKKITLPSAGNIAALYNRSIGASIIAVEAVSIWSS
jgi:hypothetical protein